MVTKNKDAGAPSDAPATTLADAPAEGSGASSSALDAPSPGPVPDASVTVSPEQLAEAIGRGVQAWLNEHTYNTPISRSTPALNYLRDQAVPRLTSVILKEVF